MNNFKIEGEIVVIDNEQVFSSKFKKRDFVIKTKDGNYDQFLKFQLVNDRCDLIDKYKAGQEITVHFNLSGRGYDKGGDTVYFTNLVAWRIEGDAAKKEVPTYQTKLGSKQPVVVNDMNEDLPF